MGTRRRRGWRAAGLSATWDILGSVVDEGIAWIARPLYGKRIGFADPGDYVVRCVAPADGRRRQTREPSSRARRAPRCSRCGSCRSTTAPRRSTAPRTPRSSAKLQKALATLEQALAKHPDDVALKPAGRGRGRHPGLAPGARSADHDRPARRRSRRHGRRDRGARAPDRQRLTRPAWPPAPSSPCRTHPQSRGPDRGLAVAEAPGRAGEGDARPGRTKRTPPSSGGASTWREPRSGPR